jgi:phosphoglycerate dehydrogenase-like enzyme
VDHILTSLFRERDIILTNSSGVHAPSIAEWVVLAMLAQEKQLAVMFRQQQERVFEKVQRDELGSKRVVILGMGHIAGEIASRLKPFGVHLTAVRRRGGESDLFDRVTTLSDRDALARADWLIIALPLTPETRGLVDADFLSVLPSHCRIVNVARGEIVVEGALLNALSSGAIGGAVLDVFVREPLPPDHPLWSMENVLVLPHTTWRSPQVHQRQISLFVENLRRYRNGEPLLNRVDPQTGY